MKITLVFFLFVLQALSQSMLQHKCPSLCSCYLINELTMVDCWGRGFLSIPGDINPYVQVLDISSNSIRHIIENIGHYELLQSLNLSHNQLQSLPSTTFHNLPLLQYLDLSYNNIYDLSQINADTFIENNTLLKELILAGNPITNLGTDSKTVTSVLTSSSLLKLDLSNCKIDTIAGSAALNNLPNLEYLDLSKNPIKWIRNFGSPSVKYLDLSYGELDFLSPNTLMTFPSLLNISLKENNMLSLPAGGLVSPSLIHFEAENCSITRLNLGRLPRLEYANLKGNKIVKLHEGELKNNKYIKELDLSYNLISEVDSNSLSGADYLENLNLAHNSLSGEMPFEVFSRNKFLQYLSVSRNEITSLKNFDNPSLKYLDASHCQIRNLDQFVFIKMPWLLSLSLSDNLLKDIPDHLFSNSLMHLDLSYCWLSTIRNETFNRLNLLQSLDLTGNRLTQPIDVTILERLPHLTSIWLGDNPWHCDCESKNFKKLWTHLTKGERMLKTETKLVKCQSPERVRGISWENSCYTVWYPAPVTNKEKFTRYGVIFLICFFSLAAVFAIASTVTRKIYKRKKRRATSQEREAAEARVAQLRSAQQGSEADEADEVIIRLRESPEQTPRWVSQPPTYEEALLMPPVRATAGESSHASDTPRSSAPRQARRQSASSAQDSDSASLVISDSEPISDTEDGDPPRAPTKQRRQQAEHVVTVTRSETM